jgi:hypothetical protein
MSIRLMCRSVLVAGVVLLGPGCGPTTDAPEQESTLQEEPMAGSFCGGIAGIPCAEGFACVDDPHDDCDPNQGGADCGGICKREAPSRRACTGREPGQQYISRDPQECATLLFLCADGFTPFFNDCGCGCQREQRRACDSSDPRRTYVSRDPEQCLAITFTCDEGDRQFFNDCGCGCLSHP